MNSSDISRIAENYGISHVPVGHHRIHHECLRIVELLDRIPSMDCLFSLVWPTSLMRSVNSDIPFGSDRNNHGSERGILEACPPIRGIPSHRRVSPAFLQRPWLHATGFSVAGNAPLYRCNGPLHVASVAYLFIKKGSKITIGFNLIHRVLIESRQFFNNPERIHSLYISPIVALSDWHPIGPHRFLFSISVFSGIVYHLLYIRDLRNPTLFWIGKVEYRPIWAT